jgi:iron complex transport system substrate-binding protein
MSHPPRVVSLLSSSTEIVAALGCADRLVGRSHECDYPPEILGLPVCSRPRLDPAATSREIDASVKSLVASELSIFEVNGQLLAELQPDLILTQTLCEVCAVSDRDVLQALGAGAGAAQLVSLKPQSFADTWNDIKTVATALGVPARGTTLVGQLRERLENLITQVAPLARPRVACLEWLDPLMAAGNWVPELVTAAGGVPVVGQGGVHSPWLSWETLAAADPEVIVLMPCGFDLPRTIREAACLTAHPLWSDLRAVRDRRVFAVDGNQYFNRPGPRLVDSAEILAAIFHGTERQGLGFQAVDL